MAELMRGTLFLVVGPSGAGKDTLLDRARAVLEPLGTHVFPSREITRPVEAGGEAHLAVTPERFAQRVAAGHYALSWSAHGLDYGIDRAIEADLSAGRHVICNVSRGVIAEARQRFRPLRIIVVTAPDAVLAQRLAARGREAEQDVAARLARAPYATPTGPDVVTIANDGSIGKAAAAVLAALQDSPGVPWGQAVPALASPAAT